MISAELSQKITSQLTAIGFTQLESDIYLYLLSNGANTGYAVAKGIGKAVANVYKGVESLTAKGAIEQSVSDSKLCVAVDWRQVLSSEKKKFSSVMAELEESLTQLPQQQSDENIYQLKNAAQVYEQTQRMIDEAQNIVMADLEPMAATRLVDALVAAAGRGVEVRVKVYQSIELPGVHITLRQRGEEVFARTRDTSFNLCADGKETMIALLSHNNEAVIQAFKTQSGLINMNMYNALVHELVLTELKALVPKGDISACQKLLDETAHLHPFSSQNSVFEHFEQRYQTQRQN